MAWIESHQELARHPKTKKLARKLGVSVPTAIGHLHMLWWWAMDYAPEGNVSKYDPEDIADAVLWDGDANKLLESLIDAKFVDNSDVGPVIHDWYNYVGKLLERRAADRERKEEAKKKKDNKANPKQDDLALSGGIPTESTQKDDGIPLDGARTVPYRTVPNRTVPNRTEPKQTEPHLPEQHLDEIEAERLRIEILREEASAATSADPDLETLDKIHLRFFGTMTMSPAISGFIQKLMETGKTEGFVKELMLEAGETSSGKPSLRFMESIEKRWTNDGISSREEAKNQKKKSTNKNGSGSNRNRGKPEMPVVSDQGHGTMKSKEEYRTALDQAYDLDGKPRLNDDAFNVKWSEYEEKRRSRVG